MYSATHAQNGAQHPDIEAADHREHRHEIDHDENQDLRDDQPRVAHRERGLHDPGRDAPGELVLVEAKALAQEQPVELPAQPHRKVRGERLLLEQRLQRNDERTRRDDRDQQQQAAAALGPELRRLHLREPVDDATEHREQHRLEHADDRRENRHREQDRPHAFRAFPHERKEASRRRQRCALRVRGHETFEPAEQSTLLGGPAASSRLEVGTDAGAGASAPRAGRRAILVRNPKNVLGGKNLRSHKKNRVDCFFSQSC